MRWHYNKHFTLLLFGWYFQIYETDPLTCNCLHSLQDDDTIQAKLPVTQIRFKHFEPEDKPEHKRIVIASCKFTWLCCTTMSEFEYSHKISLKHGWQYQCTDYNINILLYLWVYTCFHWFQSHIDEGLCLLQFFHLSVQPSPVCL